MTFLERYRKEHPADMTSDEGLIAMLCPEDLGYEKKDAPCEILETTDYAGACRACWQRETEGESVRGGNEEGDRDGGQDG